MHQQSIVYVDPECYLFFICHSPQINGFQPIQNQPEMSKSVQNGVPKSNLKNIKKKSHRPKRQKYSSLVSLEQVLGFFQPPTVPANHRNLNHCVVRSTELLQTIDMERVYQTGVQSRLSPVFGTPHVPHILRRDCASRGERRRR
jgi:hypothetical protein